MVDLLPTLGRTLGFSFAAGINLYATVAILGLASRYGWVQLPDQFRVFDNDIVIGVALTLYVIEFFADKIPWIDSLWDAVHTVIRPIGGALIAVTTLGDASPTMEGLVALLGGTIAAGSHFTKAGTRAVANTSPEPFSNWILSIAEDLFVVGLGFVALKYPTVAALIVIVAVALMIIFATWIIRAVRRRFAQSQSLVPSR
jgi:nicotinamide riboside transporter PnuC